MTKLAAPLLVFLTTAGTLTARAQEPPDRPDSVRVTPIAPLTVTVLRGTVAAGREHQPVATAAEASLRLGKTGAFLEEALDALPGVQVQNRFNFAVGERLSIRGFGSRAQFGVRGVKVLVDGVPATFADGQTALDHVDLGSVGRVEVLRGPGSALYGNAAGGVLTFESRPPASGPYRHELRATAGGDGLVNLHTLASGTVSGTGYLLSLGRLEYDGFRELSDGTGTYGAARRWNVNGRLERPLGNGRLTITLNGVDLDAENPGSLSESLLDERGPIAFGFNVAQGTGKTVSQAQMGGRWAGAVGSVDADFAAWGISRDVRNPIPPSVIDLKRAAGGARILFADSDGLGSQAITWSLGAELELQSDDRRNFDNDGGADGALTLDQHEDVLATGAFLQASFAPTPRLQLSGAVRFDRFSFEATDHFTADGDPDDSGSRTMKSWSPSGGVFIEMTPELGLFGSVASSLETPTTTELVNRPQGAGGFNPELDPQRGLTWEAGLRGTAGDRVAYELTVYRTGLEDELVPFEVPDAAGRTFFRNAGSTTRTGVEVALRAALAREAIMEATYSYVDARFDAFMVDGEDYSGNQVPGLSPHNFELLAHLGSVPWFADVELEFVDRVPVTDDGQAHAPSYEIVDLRAGLRTLAVGGLDAAPFLGVSNALDESYVTSVVVNAFGGRYYEPGPGRTLHVGLTIGWPAAR